MTNQREDFRLFETVSAQKLTELRNAMFRAEESLPSIVNIDGHARFKTALENALQSKLEPGIDSASECRLIPDSEDDNHSDI